MFVLLSCFQILVFTPLLLKDYKASFQLKKRNAASYTIIDTVMLILTLRYQPFKRQPHKLVKHTQAIADELLQCV